MNLAQEQYRSKKMTAEEAIRLVRDGDAISVPVGVGEPPTLLTALSEQRRDFHDVKVLQILPLRKFGYYDPETLENVRHVSLFLGGPSRPGMKEGWIEFIPNYFREIPRLIEEDLIHVDAVFAMASPMDKNGYFSISLGTDYTMSSIKMARTVILEVNPNTPFAYGNCLVHISQVSAIVENEDPLLEVGLPNIGQVEQRIGEYVGELIQDGNTLQIGFGAIPDAVVMQLKDKKDLGIHTEMIGDGILSLIEAGVVTNKRKNYMNGKMVATFALGSKKLYDFMNHNVTLEMHPVSFTNEPSLACNNDNLVTINATMSVDFMGQCNSESFGPVPYSGTGGQVDFVQAANRSKGGKSFIVLPSTAKNGTISRIVPTNPAGSVITTSKNDINYVVTEYGVAKLRGKTLRQRTQELINIAHPKFRDELTSQARTMNLL